MKKPYQRKLSVYQKGVLDHVAKHGGELRRIRGGFWVTPEVMLRAGNILAYGEFYTQLHTVRSLEKQGYLERTNEFPEEWRDTRKLNGQEH